MPLPILTQIPTRNQASEHGQNNYKGKKNLTVLVCSCDFSFLNGKIELVRHYGVANMEVTTQKLVNFSQMLTCVVDVPGKHPGVILQVDRASPSQG